MRIGPMRIGPRAGVASATGLALLLVQGAAFGAVSAAESGTERLRFAPFGPPPMRLSAVDDNTLACDRQHIKHIIERAQFDDVARVYWAQVNAKRSTRARRKRAGLALRKRDYMLRHPPVYRGAPLPKCRSVKARKPRKRRTLPLVSDLLREAKRLYRFTPRPTTEALYKQAMAREALRIGLTSGQVVGVYALETGGIGPYYRQSGIFTTDQRCRKIKPRGRPASTALGYAQLLAANSNAMISLDGVLFARLLRARARQATAPRAANLRAKASLVLRAKRDIDRATKRYRVRNGWREYVALGKTKLGRAVHAFNLDADIGPLMQVHKLLRIRKAARAKGVTGLSGAQMELLNLVGYGRGLEMLRPVARGVPTSNFFDRLGYERNPVAKNLTAKGLVDRIASIIRKRMRACGSVEFLRIFAQVRRARLAASQ
ncbi:MAG: hypothetical protein AAFR04_11210 [Pseudomonadota bacterium]